LTQIFPVPVVPAGTTILQAMALGILPAQLALTGFGVGAVAPSLASLISSGAVNPSALFSTLTFANPANYEGA
jgi:energy-converting hydrogenase Eha subunit A